jgi:hypothetical protein
LIQVFTRRRNIDSTVRTFRFDCFKFEFHSGAARPQCQHKWFSV